MSRAAQLLALSAAATALLAQGGCSSKCNSAFDCKSTEVCYRGTCQIALSTNLSCTVDDDCGKGLPSGTTRPYLCIAGRCQANPAASDGGSGPLPDAGPDSGMMSTPDMGMTGGDTGMPPPDTGMGTPDSGVNDDAMPGDSGVGTSCTFPTGAMSMTADSVEPELMTATLGPSTMPAAGTMLTLSLTIVEAGCGIESISVLSSSDNATANPDVMAWTVSQPTGTSPFTVMATANIGECAANVTHRITSIVIRDFAGNTSVYTAGMADTNYMRSINGQAPIATTVPVVTFTPMTAGVALGAPVLTGATATETAAGIDVGLTVTSGAMCPATEATVTVTSGMPGGYAITATGILGQTGGTIAVPIPACATGAFTVTSITLRDMAGRSATYITAAGANYFGGGMATTVMPAQVTLQRAATTDTGSPLVTGARAPAKSMAAGGTAVDVAVLANDVGCGLRGGQATLTSNDNGAMRSFSGMLMANQAGTEVGGCIAIPACAPAGTYSLLAASVSDNAGSTTTLAGAAGATYSIIRSDMGQTVTTTVTVFQVTHP